MADDVAITAGVGTSIATDDVGGRHFQAIKLDAGANGATAPVIDQAVPTVLIPTGGKSFDITVTPTVGTAAYVAKDAVGALLTFANAARASGGSFILDSVTVVDKSQTMLSLELVLFNVTFTAPTDSSVFDPTDAELLTCVGVVPLTTWYDFNDNSVTHRSGLGLNIVLAGTSLFGALVARSAGSLTNGDIQVKIAITQN